jgi:uncharacterized protein
MSATVPIIDVDSHLIEPADLWTSRMTGRFADAAPRVVWDERWGRERWLVGDYKLIGVQDMSQSGWKEFWPSVPHSTEEADPGGYDPKVRLHRLDEHGIAAQVLYPNLLGFFPQAFISLGAETATRCVQVFNDFQMEWCSEDPERLFPLAFLPFWDLDAAVTELKRCAELGYVGFNWGHRFEIAGLPPMRDAYWDPVMYTAQDLDLPVSFHVGFASIDLAGAEEYHDLLQKETTIEQDMTSARMTVLSFMGNVSVIADLCLGGVCERYPHLKFVSIESGFGYVPFLLEMMDWQYKNNRASVRRKGMPLPSEYFRRQVYCTFWFEKDSLDLLKQIPDNVMFESDYPHGTSLSPGPGSIALSAKDTADQNLAGLPEDLRRKVLHDTAARVYKIDA